MATTAARPTDQEVLTRFDRDGYFVIEGALTSDQVQRLERDVDDVWAAERGGPPERESLPLHLLGFCGRGASFLELLDQPSVLPFIVSVLGTNIFLYHCHLDVHPPELETSHPWSWHRDGGVQNRDLGGHPRPRMSVKIAYFLTDVSEPGRGNFMVLPGSHRRDTIDRPADDDNDISGAVPVLARPGDAVLFDRRLWHMRSPNRSDLTRKALFLAYTFRWVRPRDELRVREDLRDLITPIRAQLLGQEGDPIDFWMPDMIDLPLRGHTAG
jgi:ectoine hydroxylase-related dioxygenase (phytanoyl-CoA dioxygenase family)